MRIGTAEIYRAIDELIEADTAAAAAAVPSVAGAEALEEVLVVGQPIKLADIQPDPAFDQLTEADLPTFLRRTFPTR